jgi:hypothetical protein
MSLKPSHGATDIKTAARLRTATNQRTIQVWESAFNASKLNDYHWNFQIAKSVYNGDGTATFNVVWQSKSVAPNTLIVWQDAYALNWTATVPAPGVSVTVFGDWQACSPGQSYDLDPYGFWTPTKPDPNVKPDPKFMNVGNIQYKYPDVDGIHIVIGVQNDNGGVDIIYVDPTALPPNSSAKYQPKELVEWWYQTDIRTSTMINGASTAIGRVDLSTPAPTTQDYYYSTTFNYDDGTWVTSPDTPSTVLYSPALHGLGDPPLFSLWSAILEIIFNLAVSDTATVSAKLGALLRVKYNNVEVTVLDSLHFQVSIGAPKRVRPNSSDAIGVVTDDITAEVSDLLQFEVDDGDLQSQSGDALSWNVVKIAA